MNERGSPSATGLARAVATRRQILAQVSGAALAATLAAAPSPVRASAALSRVSAGSDKRVDHAAWDRLLEAYVVPGRDGINRVDYARFKAQGHRALKAYVAALETADPTTLDRTEFFAYFANLYNARTIDIVLDKYPVRSIKDISLGGGLKALLTGGPWQAKVVTVKGEPLSLDDIEHGIMRPFLKDPRVHYSVNCASIGCPNLGTEAFTGTRLEGQLEAAARAFINHPRGIAVEGGKVTASSIYSWFQADFGGSATGVLEHVRRYAEPALAQKLSAVSAIDAYEYDWTLNDSKSVF